MQGSRFVDCLGRDAVWRSPLPFLLPVSNFIPHGAALLTSPVGLAGDDRCQRPELLRSAFRTLRRLQGTIVLSRCRRFAKALEIHDREPRTRRDVRNNGKTWIVG